jgi:YbbR domain-containing protein
VTFITANWQLKLLSVLLSMGLLSVVAFEQNPVKSVTVKASVSYQNIGNRMLIDPVTKVDVTIFGTSAQLQNFGSTTVIVPVDLAKVPNGQHQLVAHPSIPGASGVAALQNNIPITVDLDDRDDTSISIEVRVSYAPGWEQTPDKPPTIDPSSVALSLPAGMVGSGADQLKAFVAVGPLQGDQLIPGLPIQFEKGGKPFKFPNTAPSSAFSPTDAKVQVFARKPVVTRQVTLIETPSGQPASGYRVSGVQISPLYVTVTGPADMLQSLDSITLPAQGIPSNATSDVSFRVQVPFPNGVSSDTKIAVVTVNISQNPAVQPSPTPSPPPTH